MISPFAIGSLSADLLGPLAELLGLPREGLALNTDQWDGYTDDRRELLAHLRDNAIRNTVFLTGDIHMAWANDVPHDAGTYPLSASAATEFVVTSVTSDNLDDIMKAPEGTISAVAAPVIRAANRHVHWVDTDRHGYGVLDLTADRAQMDYYVLSDRIDRDATSSWARSYRTRSGTQKVERTVVRQVGVGVQVTGPGVSVDLDLGTRSAHLQIPGAQPVVRLERVRLGHVQLDRQVVHRGARCDVRRAVQEQQPARLLVAEGQGLGDGGAEREPGVHQPPLRVGRGGEDGPLQQLVLADPVLVRHALLDRVERTSLEEVRRPHLVPGVAQPVRGLAHRGPEAMGRVEEHDVHEAMVPAGYDNAGSWQYPERPRSHMFMPARGRLGSEAWTTCFAR
jgi:alkaline phosphatase D